MKGVTTRENASAQDDAAFNMLRLARFLNYTVIALMICGVLFIAGRIVTAFTSGRVEQILHQAAQTSEETR